MLENVDKEVFSATVEHAANAAWWYLHNITGFDLDYGIIVDISHDRRRTRHGGGLYKFDTGIGVLEFPGILIATACFDKKYLNQFVEYPQIQLDPVIGNVFGAARMVAAAVCHEVAHAFEDYHRHQDLVKHFSTHDYKSFRHHSAVWCNIYYALREQFVNDLVDNG